MIAGMRPKGEKARAIKVTVFKRWQDSKRLELRPTVRPACLHSLATALSVI